MKAKHNSYYLFTDKNQLTHVDTFNILIQESYDNGYIVLFSVTISSEAIKANNLSLSIYIPWLNNKCEINESMLKWENDSGTCTAEPWQTTLWELDTPAIPKQTAKGHEKILSIKFNINASILSVSPTKLTTSVAIEPDIPFLFKRHISLRGMGELYCLDVNDSKHIPKDLQGLLKEKELSSFREFNLVSHVYKEEAEISSSDISAKAYGKRTTNSRRFDPSDIYMRTVKTVNTQLFSSLSIRPKKFFRTSYLILTIVVVISIVVLAVVIAKGTDAHLATLSSLERPKVLPFPVRVVGVIIFLLSPLLMFQFALYWLRKRILR